MGNQKYLIRRPVPAPETAGSYRYISIQATPGPAFSLKRFADRLSEEKDPNAGNGIRILLNAAKSINYYRTYGMNTTIIRV